MVFKFDYKDIRDVIDIHKNGIRIFTYCTDPLDMLSSVINTGLLWLGGSGTSKYLPMLRSKALNYKTEGIA